MGFIRKMLGMKELPPPMVHRIDDGNFKKEVAQSDVPVLLDVWSDSCAPCKQLVPVVKELSRLYAGRLKVAELNIGTGMRTAQKLGVRGTPTVLYFHKGRVMERVVGFRGQLYHQEYLENELLPRVEGTGQAAAAGE